MGKGVKAARLLLGMVFLFPVFLPPGIFPQETSPAGANQESEAPLSASTIPDVLRRPERSEAPRYPEDLVIGRLGQGEAPEAAYLFALTLLQALMAGSKDSPVVASSSSVLTEAILEEIGSLQPRSYRLGGGKIEADGNVSFLIRFVGPEESVTGELYVRQAEETSDLSVDKPVSDTGDAHWILDDFVLEEKRPLAEVRDSYRYDFSPYERFY